VVGHGPLVRFNEWNSAFDASSHGNTNFITKIHSVPL
jgi:hypothetical protein